MFLILNLLYIILTEPPPPFYIVLDRQKEDKVEETVPDPDDSGEECGDPYECASPSTYGNGIDGDDSCEPPTQLPQPPSTFVGRTVNCYFGAILHKGKVVGWDIEDKTGKDIFSVKYDDGDIEDLYLNELQEVLVEKELQAQLDKEAADSIRAKQQDFQTALDEKCNENILTRQTFQVVCITTLPGLSYLILHCLFSVSHRRRYPTGGMKTTCNNSSRPPVNDNRFSNWQNITCSGS